MMLTLKTIAKRIPVIVLFLIVVELVWTNTLVRSGREVTGIDLKIADLRETNELLAQQVASASALTTIAARAKEAGFVEPTKNSFVMLAQPVPVAFVP